MRAMILSSIGTTFMYLIHRWRNLRFSIWFYVFAFSLGMLMMSFLSASEVPQGFVRVEALYDYKCNYFDDNVHCFSKSLTPKQRKEFTKKRDFSLREAKRCEREGIERCWWIPCPDDRTVMRATVQTFLAGVVSLYSKAGVMGMILSAFTEYSFSCIDEYYYIKEKLQWAQYHYENYMWYQNVLDNA